MGLLKLPNEILIYITEFLNQQREIFSLSLVCRRLGFLLDYSLYRHNILYSGSSALHWAARYGRFKTATKVLETCARQKGLSPRGKACVNISSTNGGPTALSIAVQHENLEIAKLLLSAGANPNTKSHLGESLCCWAARNGHLESVKLLREQGAHFGPEDTTESQLLPLFLAARGRHYAVARYIWDNLKLNSKIAFENEQTQALLLYIAAACGWEAIVERMLRYGCPVDAIWMNGTIFQWPQRGLPPICGAAAHGHFSLTETLLRHKANPNPAAGLPADLGPMFWAILGGHEAIVKLLLDHGANPNLFDSRRRSALTLALPHPEIFQLLLHRGAHVIDRRIIVFTRALLLFLFLCLACCAYFPDFYLKTGLRFRS